ncbi:MAG TPA: hypothetical protein VKS21_06790 [Spirochaetota bacterium]|nr:hypothetical protein [Spirochaetota bacterium]
MKNKIFISVFIAVIIFFSWHCSSEDKPFAVFYGLTQHASSSQDQTNEEEIPGMAIISGKVLDGADDSYLSNVLITVTGQSTENAGNTYVTNTLTDGTYAVNVPTVKGGYQFTLTASYTNYNNQVYDYTVTLTNDEIKSNIEFTMYRKLVFISSNSYSAEDMEPGDITVSGNYGWFLQCDADKLASFYIFSSGGISGISTVNPPAGTTFNYGNSGNSAGITMTNGQNSVWITRNVDNQIIDRLSTSTGIYLDSISREDFSCFGMHYSTNTGTFWLTGYDNRLREVSPGGVTLTNVYLGDSPVGITEKNGYLYIVKQDTDLIVKVDMTTCRVIARGAAPGQDCIGIAWDGDCFWMTDNGNDSIREVYLTAE